MVLRTHVPKRDKNQFSHGHVHSFFKGHLRVLTKRESWFDPFGRG